MAKVNDGILTLTEAEAMAMSAWLSHGAQKAAAISARESMGLMGDQLIRMMSSDPFEGRRFVVEVEQVVRRC